MTKEDKKLRNEFDAHENLPEGWYVKFTYYKEKRSVDSYEKIVKLDASSYESAHVAAGRVVMGEGYKDFVYHPRIVKVWYENGGTL